MFDRFIANNLLVRERPNLKVDSNPLVPETVSSHLDEYARVAASIGFNHPHVGTDLAVEDFKSFLRTAGITVFNLQVVIKYMDDKAAKESAAKSGWHWRPLRNKDAINEVQFGTRAYDDGRGHRTPASDHYHGSHMSDLDQWGRRTDGTQRRVEGSGAPYDKLVPLHAIKKVAVIEATYSKPVSFFVCDYAPAPHIEHPDPFLMAVINNGRLNQGVGRFVIDFWDEPGFGLDKQLVEG